MSNTPEQEQAIEVFVNRYLEDKKKLIAYVMVLDSTGSVMIRANNKTCSLIGCGKSYMLTIGNTIQDLWRHEVLLPSTVVRAATTRDAIEQAVRKAFSLQGGL